MEIRGKNESGDRGADSTGKAEKEHYTVFSDCRIERSEHKAKRILFGLGLDSRV